MARRQITTLCRVKLRAVLKRTLKLLLFLFVTYIVIKINILCYSYFTLHDSSVSNTSQIMPTTELRYWLDPYWCEVQCITGTPCEYKDEVDLRIILMTYNRPLSLSQALNRINNIEMMGHRLSVDIWIDKSPDGTYHTETVSQVGNYSKHFRNGRICVHFHTHHAFISNQWVNTYRPRRNTQEIAIILEDDIDLSPHVWKWYKALHKHFRNTSDIAGYTLKMQDLKLRDVQRSNVALKGPKHHTVVLYSFFQAWGFSPQPNVWRDFQDWYHKVRKDISPNDKVNKKDSIVPAVHNSLHFMWWEEFQRRNFQESIAHEMFHIYYTNVVRRYMFTVYSNLLVYCEDDGKKKILLCVNRKEKGLHYAEKAGNVDTSRLLVDWNEKYINFPKKPVRLNMQGKIVERV